MSADGYEDEIEVIKCIGEPEHKVASIITAWLPKYFVVDFANLGEISGDRFACAIASLV